MPRRDRPDACPAREVIPCTPPPRKTTGRPARWSVRLRPATRSGHPAGPSVHRSGGILPRRTRRRAARSRPNRTANSPNTAGSIWPIWNPCRAAHRTSAPLHPYRALEVWVERVAQASASWAPAASFPSMPAVLPRRRSRPRKDRSPAW